MTMTPEAARAVSDAVLSTVECLLDTCPDLQEREIEFLDRSDGEEITVRMMRVRIDGEPFLIQCKRGGTWGTK